MQPIISKLLVLVLLLSFAGVLFVGTINVSHSFDEHGMSSGMTDCPFMTHEETLCPMTALDHLAMLQNIFEATLPSIIMLTFIVGMILITFPSLPKLKTPLRPHMHTFWRWRRSVLYHFSYKLYQDLFSQGILHPKLFSTPLAFYPPNNN